MPGAPAGVKTVVYVLDDDPVTGEVCADLLRNMDCQVEVCQESRSLLGLMKQHPPDAVFVDMLTEGVDSLTLSRHIRQDLNLPAVKLVLLESPTANVRVSASKVVADAYLEKPLGHEQVRALLQSLRSGMTEVRFWGVRGSIAAPGPEHDRYGGNTSCVSVKLALDEYLVLDAGTGIREFGNYLIRLGLPVRLHLLISHAHWDHIQGLPFFRPGYLSYNDLALYGADQSSVPFQKVIADQMRNTYFPVPLETMRAHLHFHRMTEGSYQVAEAKIETMFLKHPGATLGFRISLRGKSMVYLCDTEITPDDAAYRKKVESFVRGVQLLVADAQYTPGDFPEKAGWGHSMYTEVLDMAIDAGVERLVLTHHDPDRGDDALDRIAADCHRRVRERGSHMLVGAAAEGTAIFL